MKEIYPILEDSGAPGPWNIQGRHQYDALYKQSIEDPDVFWSEQAEELLHWNTKWTLPVCQSNIDVSKGPVSIKWFQGATLNACYNAVDRHVEAGYAERVAFYWEGNDVGQEAVVTYGEMRAKVCQIANWLKSVGVKKGDDVTIYMPMVPELPACMLACARIGAVHNVVFAGFSAEALSGRIIDSEPRVVITASGSKRGPKEIALKKIVDEALLMAEADGHAVEHCLVFDHASTFPTNATPMTAGRDLWWRDGPGVQPTECPVEWVDAEHPLFKIYTSGSTGKPKGVLHTTGGYCVYTACTVKYVMDAKPSDVYWCTADCGWITGHSYITYGPMFHAATQVLFEGVPNYPDASRAWHVVDKYKVSVFYTAPTAIRALMMKGDTPVHSTSRTSLRLLGTVGEPINPEAWRWYYEVVGDCHCPIVDTWWQTETGGHMITPLPGAVDAKPGSASLPFFGVQPVIVNEHGKELQGECEGMLMIAAPWPGMMRTVAGDHARFEQTYFAPFKGLYFTGDGARRDKDGYYWIIGRVDDVINVSGHRIGTAEVESALVHHPAVAEAAVVPMEHAIKGQALYAYVTLMEGHDYPGSEQLRQELIDTVRRVIGAIATPDVIHWAPHLPKTRSGKIMRRFLRKIANHEEDQLGDTSTLADPGVVHALVALRGK